MSVEEPVPHPSLVVKVRRLLFGPPRDIEDRAVFHHIALVPVLAWIGMGADGLSSSAYGPEEAFRALGEHTFLALPLAGLMIATILILCACYSGIIEQFPQGGGGYVVSTALLGRHAGLVAGCALLIDYVLTITVSTAAAGAALFSFLPPEWHGYKIFVVVVITLGLVTMNIRGVRESVLMLTPIFVVFAVTHLVAIAAGLWSQSEALSHTASTWRSQFDTGLSKLGPWALLLAFIHAYSLGGGTYTGIEAVSNGLSIMREPRVQTGKRTMLYLGLSLAVAASGLLLCYWLWNIAPDPNRTMNAVLLERVTEQWPLGGTFTVIAILSEGALLIIAAQTGFIDGPRVVGNMAADFWMPRSFAALSERLTYRNGIILMGVASLAALWYTRGNMHQLIVMYSINVFLAFSLSLSGMLRSAVREARAGRVRKRRLALYGTGVAFCVTILLIMIVEKFGHGGWLTLAATSVLVTLCILIRRHYQQVAVKLQGLRKELMVAPVTTDVGGPAIDPQLPTAGLLVVNYDGMGVHTMLNVIRAFPGHFKNFVFLSVGIMDSGEFKGEQAVEGLRHRTEEMLDQYVRLAHRDGMPAARRFGLGTDVVSEAEELCLKVAEEFPSITFFAGRLVFEHENWFERLLHNQTSMAIQRRLHWAGKFMVILPVRLR